MYEFSPNIINQVFKTCPIKWHQNSETSRVKLTNNALAKYLSNGQVSLWKEFRPSLMSKLLGNLHLLCCLNWVPTTNNTTATIERCKLLYMMDKRIPFNFGKLVYDQVEKSALLYESKDRVVPFPNLIYRVLSFQREIEFILYEIFEPKPEVFSMSDVVGNGVAKKRFGDYIFGINLANDIQFTASLFTDIATMIERGDYGTSTSTAAQNPANEVDVPEADDAIPKAEADAVSEPGPGTLGGLISTPDDTSSESSAETVYYSEGYADDDEGVPNDEDGSENESEAVS